MRADDRVAGLAVQGRSHAHNFGCFIGADETTGAGRVIRMNVNRGFDSLTQGGNHWDLQVAHRVNAIGAQAFEQFLNDWPKNIVRAKGWVKFRNHVPVTLSQAGRQIVLEPRMEPLQQHELEALPLEEQTRYHQVLVALNPEPTEIVFIGQGILKQRQALEDRLNACIWKA